MKKAVSLFLALHLFAASAFMVSAGENTISAQATQSSAENNKNIIMMIPDGQSLDALTLARWYKGGASLALDEMACGLVRTYASDSAITDSAPAATAFATGFKSHTGFIGVLPDVANMPGLQPIAKGQERKPVANVLEAAKLAGKSTGIIATSEIMHATPAGFTSHVVSRKDYDSISEQQVYQGVDVVLGSGSLYFSEEGRSDGEDLIDEIKKRGYDYFTTPEAMRNTTASKLFGMFAPKDMSYEFDRNPEEQPSLAEMTKKAIETLNKNEKGFFLLVEGSKVDWAAHANDPIGVISDTLAYDDAVKVALDFAKSDGNTVVISTSDHGNGGISIGNQNTTGTYDKTHIDEYILPLKKAVKTGEGIEKLFNSDFSNVSEIMSQYYGIDDLTQEEINAIKTTGAGSMNYTVGPMISRRANIGWTTGGHTGEEVPLFIYAPAGLGMTGVIDNTEIARYIEKIFDVNLKETTDRLFVPVRSAMEELGAVVTWDVSDAKNPVVTVQKARKTISMPVNKSIAYVNGEEVSLSGVIVYNGITTYVPQDAINLIKE